MAVSTSNGFEGKPVVVYARVVHKSQNASVVSLLFRARTLSASTIYRVKPFVFNFKYYLDIERIHPEYTVHAGDANVSPLEAY
eukprot:m.1666154 g.1666154  ORF g.1666154 m.1666154 type:complete len:83 (-) comp144067_c0_seq1:170-418(-)